MEGLEKLEELQRTIQLLHSAGISEPNPHSQYFLAYFTSLLMMQHSGELHISDKCQLITKHMSKISSLLIEVEMQSAEEVFSQVHVSEKIIADDVTNMDTSKSLSIDGAMVGIDAMIRSNSTLEDFCRSYFMFHNMEANEPRSIFKFLPMLSFMESFIYQLDDLNENLLSRNRVPGSVSKFKDYDPNLVDNSEIMFEKDPFRPLLIVLERRELLTPRIVEELRCGEEYWALERKLCYALASNKKISIEDVTRAIHLKSFDYRMLNLVLYQLRGEKVNDLHMEFLSISELLVEVSDDLFDYEDDVAENNFNVLRMYVTYYGASSAPVMLAKFITEAEEKYEKVSKELDPELWTMYQKRCEEATKEGGKTFGYSLGTWQIPPVIKDEIAYRSAFPTSMPSVEYCKRGLTGRSF